MNVIRKYTAMMVGKTVINEEHKPNFTFGNESGPYYSVTTPETEFDTDIEATEYAYKTDKWACWLIVPIVRFDNF